MKTAKDPRHLKRIQAVQEIFACGFGPQTGISNINYPSQSLLTRLVLNHLDRIDGEIKNAATEYPLEHINKIDLSILRLSVFELISNQVLTQEEKKQFGQIFLEETPYKVVIDEAVEIAKQFGSDSSPSFINGVLGNIITLHKLDQKSNNISKKGETS